MTSGETQVGCGDKRKAMASVTAMSETRAKKRARESSNTIATTPPPPTVGCGGDKRRRKTMSSVTATPPETRAKKRARESEQSSSTIATSTLPTTEVKRPKRTPPTIEVKRLKRAYRRRKYLDHDLIMEQILPKLPVDDLLRCGSVSKSWYNSIHNDKRLTYTHFLQSQKKPSFIFNLLNVRNGVTDTGVVRLVSHFFKLAQRPYSRHMDHKEFKMYPAIPVQATAMELVGYCNGLPCLWSSGGRYRPLYTILQIYRGEWLNIACKPIFYTTASIICHGFGFDSLTNEYKVVSVYHTTDKELNLIVFTLGAKSWRDVTPASTLTSVHGRPIIRIRAATGKDRQAIFCSNAGSGCLVWKIIATIGESDDDDDDDDDDDNNNQMEMLLFFNLHDEKFQLVQFPTKGTNGEEQKQVSVDYPHLLEFKGYPCIASVEKLSGNDGSDCYNPLRHHRHGSGSCCCCCKVHLYLFKDEVKQEWVKEESFDVCVKPSKHLDKWCGEARAPDPCCFCFGSTTAPPTRIFSFHDQIFLYWFDGIHLHIFDLRSKNYLCASHSYFGTDYYLFKAKMTEPSRTGNIDDGDDEIYCSSMDYQLHCLGENFLSLQPFVPEGVDQRDIRLLRS